MKRILNIFFIILFLGLVNCQKDDIEVQFTTSHSGKVTNAETGQPISGVVISDGYITGVTDESGTYAFTGSTNARHVFYSVPEMYEIPLKDGYPSFYKKINTSLDSIKTNFELTPLEKGIENEFTLLCVADPQIKYTKDIDRLNNETIIDLEEESQAHKNVYGVTLGDLVFDEPELMEDLKEAFISTQIQFFHTIGNHDHIRNYENIFGPTDYSFNRGKVHVVIMKNILFKGNSYNAGFTREQINWLKSDLRHVPKNKMLIVCLHIPIVDNNKVKYRNDFLDLIQSFKEAHIMSGHYHRNKNYWHSDYNIYEHITGTASGIWWAGTVNKCGAPNGYGVYEIDANKMKNWYYKSVNYPTDFQIRMYAPYTFGDTKGYVVANVWNVDKEWTIELLENGVSSGEMEQFTGYDPGTYTFLNNKHPKQSNYFRETEHLFRLKPIDKNAEFSIKAIDRFGNVYIQEVKVENVSVFEKYES